MGQSLNPLRTHEEVPDDVKASIVPILYTPAPMESRPLDHIACDECGEQFGWFSYSTNCDWCGRQLCTRCCPDRHLLNGNPGCTECTRKAFRIRREEMLEDHLGSVGVRQQHRQQTAAGVPMTREGAGGVSAVPQEKKACILEKSTVLA